MNEKEFNETLLSLLEDVDFSKAKKVTRQNQHFEHSQDKVLYRVEFPENILTIENVVVGDGRGLVNVMNLVEIDGNPVDVLVPEPNKLIKELNDIIDSYDDGKKQKCIDALKNIVKTK